MSRQFKNRKAVDPYGKDYSQIPSTIQWGDMMISKDATPEIWEKYAEKIRAGEESPQPYRNSMRQRTDRELIERGLADNEAKLRYSYNAALQKKESSERLLRINTLEDARREFPNRPDDELRQILDTTSKTRKYLEADAKKYAATGGGFPTYEEWKIQAEAEEKEHQRRMQAQPQPLRSVPAGTIREPLFGRNPDGSPKPRPPGMDSEQVLALAQAQERQYNPPQKTTKKTSKATSAKTASTPPGVIGYDALNQPVYGKAAPTQKPAPNAQPVFQDKITYTDSQGNTKTREPIFGIELQRAAQNAAPGLRTTLTAEEEKKVNDLLAKKKGQMLFANGVEAVQRFAGMDSRGEPVFTSELPSQYQQKPQQPIDRRGAGLTPPSVNRDIPSNLNKVWTGSYDNAGDPIYGVAVPGMKVNVPKGKPLPKEQVLAAREAFKQTQQYKDAEAFANSGKPGSRTNPLPGQLPTGERLQWVDTGGRDKDGHPIYGVKATPEQLKKAQSQSFSGGVVKPNSAASSAKAQKDEQPLRDMQGNRIKLDDMYISGGLGKSAESKKESAASKKKASQPASTKGAGQAGGSFRVINGQVRFFGSGADAASEVEAVKPTGMR